MQRIPLSKRGGRYPVEDIEYDSSTSKLTVTKIDGTSSEVGPIGGGGGKSVFTGDLSELFELTGLSYGYKFSIKKEFLIVCCVHKSDMNIGGTTTVDNVIVPVGEVSMTNDFGDYIEVGIDSGARFVYAHDSGSYSEGMSIYLGSTKLTTRLNSLFEGTGYIIYA